MVDDGHRLTDHVEASCRAFEELLASL